ncbi:MAG: DNA mismatch endonuclease Vsr [Candidatus Aminicenantes bacterium]|nr:DNA mismatch endonuclease Vsr [Candidatus Aminicenantes bacterium]
MDIWTKEKRSKVMSNIRSTDTSPEIRVRKMLFTQGYRYRLHVKNLPGKPDIVLPKYNAVVFVHGCFWHLHSGCRDGTIPKTRTSYWKDKLLKNKERDKDNINELRKQGWRVLQLWECEVENKSEEVLERLDNFLRVT